jgi:hypothetical protein
MHENLLSQKSLSNYDFREIARKSFATEKVVDFDFRENA